jgi:hypothetical protein
VPASKATIDVPKLVAESWKLKAVIQTWRVPVFAGQIQQVLPQHFKEPRRHAFSKDVADQAV